jgi:hypothetical protein
MLTALRHFFASIVAVVESLADDAEHEVAAFDEGAFCAAFAVEAKDTAVTSEPSRAKTTTQAVRRTAFGFIDLKGMISDKNDRRRKTVCTPAPLQAFMNIRKSRSVGRILILSDHKRVLRNPQGLDCRVRRCSHSENLMMPR